MFQLSYELAVTTGVDKTGLPTCYRIMIIYDEEWHETAEELFSSQSSGDASELLEDCGLKKKKKR